MRMSKQEKKGLVPELRFPEFQDAGEWKRKPLAPYIEQYSERVSSNTELEVYSSTREGLKPQSQYYDGRNLVNDGEYGVVPTGYFVYRHMSDDDVFKFNLNQLDKNIAVSKEYPVFKAVNLDPRFLLNKLNEGQEFKRFAASQKKGGTRTRLYFKTLRTFESFLPGLREQQKIADCLTSLDELIAAQAQKLDALKTHKKGLLQQLFPAEGETVPKLRFPEFRDKGEWGVEKLEELAKRGSGHTPNKQIPSYYNGGIKWVSLADSNKLDNGYIYATKIQISKEGIENSSAVLHPAGAVILSRDAGVGKSAILHSEMAVSQHFIAWDCDETKLSNWFLYYVLQILKPAFESVAVGNTIKTIGLPYFKELCISVPSINEQKIIADCLTSLDDLITAQSQKLEALKAHKKGLMQQLFPAMDEVAA
jgi:type I restriction enzyme S subunit